MSKLKNNKGITLVALIITIIVLLILAMVSIRLVMNGGIIGRAEKGTKAYSEAEVQEQIKLAYAEWQTAQFTGETRTAADFVKDRLNSTYGDGAVTDVTETSAGVFTVKFSDGREYSYNVTTGTAEKVAKWNDNGDGTWTHSETGQKIQIGDIVNYNEGTGYTYTTDTTKGIGGSLGNSGNKDDNGKYVLESKTYTTEDLTWRVLGINESGQIELISENPTSEDVYLANEEGYLYGADNLNKFCNDLYGKGNGAISARNLNMDDVDKLAGITETNKSTFGYGSKWQYRYPTEQEVSTTRYLQYRTDLFNRPNSWNNITNNDRQKFKMPGAAASSEINSTNPGYSIEFTNDDYYYNVSEKLNKIAADGKRISDLLSKGTTSGYKNQWLSSQLIHSEGAGVIFGLRILTSANAGTHPQTNSMISLYTTYCESNYHGYRARPVVTLNSNVKLSGSSESGWTIE